MGSSSNANSTSFSFEEEKFCFEEAMAMGTGTSTSTVYAGGSVSSSRASASLLTSSSPSQTSSKRPGPSYASQGSPQQPMGRCQVEGCGVDLSGAKAYYCKHRVCGPHSKAPRVVVGGIEQRFCQQCSRFHLLSEFDQGKRSCRRRLAGHNERRRKPPSGPLSHARQFSPFFQEVGGTGSSGFVMDFTRPTTTVAFVPNQQPCQAIPTIPPIGAQPFLPTTPTHQQFLSSSNETLNLAGASNSGHALSLLSSPVQWGRTTGDSIQGPFSFRPLNEGNSSSFNHGYSSASSVHAQQHDGLDMMERPVTATVQYSGHLGSTLHGSRESMRDGNTRNYEGGGGDIDAHDTIHWSL